MAKGSLNKVLQGLDSYLRFGDTPAEPHYFPSSLLALNYMVVQGESRGIPGGRIIQLLGEKSSGKTTLSLDLLAQAQKTGLKELEIKGRKVNAVVLDFERSYDPVYAETIGVDNEKVLVVRTHYAEESFTIAEALLLEGIQFVLVDSIGVLVPQDEEDKSYADNEKLAAEAKSLGRFVKRCNAFMSDQALVVIINQYRANISPMARTEKKPYGARIMQYINQLTLELRQTEKEEDRKTIELLQSKNKIGGIENSKLSFDIVFGEGIDYKQHLLDLAVEMTIVRKSGAWYYYGDHKAQGASNARETFPFDNIRAAIIKNLEEGE